MHQNRHQNEYPVRVCVIDHFRGFWTSPGSSGYPVDMQVTVEIPDDMARRLALLGPDPARTALEALAIEGYRSGALSALQTRRLLGFETRYELDGFLKAHNVWEHSYGLEDLEKDRETIKQLEAEDRLKG
jgi:predicted HTH domain antitoxin